MTNQRKPRGPYRKSAERREQILQAAYEAVDEHGERASLQDIADRVGVTQPALTYYFPTRDALLLAVLERRDVLGKELAKDSRAGTHTIDAVVATTRHTTEHPGLAKLYVTLSAAATDPASPAHRYFAERYRGLAAETTRDVEAQQRAGAVRDDEPAAHVARMLLAVLDGLQIQWMHDPSVDIAAIAESFTRVLTAAAGPAREATPDRPA
ncbi:MULTISPECIES: TetR/AcrR family transcriptional regulator [unclassified Streptomyces]|uniref:TetR/AcrR family transcriptional regulator n=1 Tax=unclassified Streptomyces TaxID=2593676 RepID=UPI002E794D2A|nr:TetR/AcrR family transcriptional regulator [Streptomyces sp. JV176]MEE1802186.1 TetR/AcrR family transcriptional regulator [Streptomyces sp. JV176]